MKADIQIQLLQLTDGARLIRLEDPNTGLSVERRLNADASVVAQKAKLMRLFESMLASDRAAA
jgi:hypothetical protein